MPAFAKNELDTKFNQIQDDIYEIYGIHDNIKTNLSDCFDINAKSVSIKSNYQSFIKEINYQLDEIDSLNKQINHLKLDYNENEEKDSSKIEILNQHILGLSELTSDYKEILARMREVTELINDKNINNLSDINKNDNQGGGNESDGGSGGSKTKPDYSTVDIASALTSVTRNNDANTTNDDVRTAHKSASDILSSLSLDGKPLDLKYFKPKTSGKVPDISLDPKTLVEGIAAISDSITTMENRISTLQVEFEAAEAVPALRGTGVFVGEGIYRHEIMEPNEPAYSMAQKRIKEIPKEISKMNMDISNAKQDLKKINNIYNQLNKTTQGNLDLYVANSFLKDAFNEDGSVKQFSIGGKKLSDVEAKEFADNMKAIISDPSKYSFNGKTRPNNVKNGLYLSDYNNLLAGYGSLSDFLRFKGTSELYNGIGNFSSKEIDTIHGWEKSILDKGEDYKNDKAALNDNDFFYYDLVAGHKVEQMDATNDIQLDDFISDAYGTINKYVGNSDDYKLLITDAKWAGIQDASWKNQENSLQQEIAKYMETDLSGDNLTIVSDLMYRKNELSDTLLAHEANYEDKMAKLATVANEKGDAEKTFNYLQYADIFGKKYMDTLNGIKDDKLSLIDRVDSNVFNKMFSSINNDIFADKIIDEMDKLTSLFIEKNSDNNNLQNYLSIATAAHLEWNKLFNQKNTNNIDINEALDSSNFSNILDVEEVLDSPEHAEDVIVEDKDTTTAFENYFETTEVEYVDPYTGEKAFVNYTIIPADSMALLYAEKDKRLEYPNQLIRDMTKEYKINLDDYDYYISNCGLFYGPLIQNGVLIDDRIQHFLDKDGTPKASERSLIYMDKNGNIGSIKFEDIAKSNENGEIITKQFQNDYIGAYMDPSKLSEYIDGGIDNIAWATYGFGTIYDMNPELNPVFVDADGNEIENVYAASHATINRPRTCIGKLSNGDYVMLEVDTYTSSSNEKSALGGLTFGGLQSFATDYFGPNGIAVTGGADIMLPEGTELQTLINCDGGGSTFAELNGVIFDNVIDSATNPHTRAVENLLFFLRKK